MLKWPFSEVHGFVTHEDKERLLIMAGYCSSLPGCFVEIGCLEGLSSLCILSAPGNKVLHACDSCLSDAYMKNIASAAQLLRVQPMPGDFRSQGFPHEIAFAFVDHDHEYETTRDAWGMLWPSIVPGGVLAFHDFEHPDYPGGTRFLKEMGLTNRTQGSSIVYKMKERTH